MLAGHDCCQPVSHSNAHGVSWALRYPAGNPCDQARDRALLGHTALVDTAICSWPFANAAVRRKHAGRAGVAKRTGVVSLTDCRHTKYTGLPRAVLNRMGSEYSATQRRSRRSTEKLTVCALLSGMQQHLLSSNCWDPLAEFNIHMR